MLEVGSTAITQELNSEGEEIELEWEVIAVTPNARQTVYTVTFARSDLPLEMLIDPLKTDFTEGDLPVGIPTNESAPDFPLFTTDCRKYVK